MIAGISRVCDRGLCRWLCAVVVACIPLSKVDGAVLNASPANYEALVHKLQPGDTLSLEAGVYRNGLVLHGLRGTAAEPIRIRGPSEGPAAVFMGRPGRDTVRLSNAAHVEISHLVFDGADLPVDAIKADGSKRCVHVNDIVLEDLVIMRHGADQQIVGIASMCTAWNWIIRRNLIIGAGTGLYLGQSDGTAAFVGGLIEQNLFIDTRGYNLQIKHQNERAKGSGMPSGTRKTVIRHNLFTKARNASSAKDARPNLLLGHFPRQGDGSDDVYEVTNNVFFCNPGESLLQGEGNLDISGNIFVNPIGDAVSIQPHHDVPRHVIVRGNFVAASGNNIHLTKASPVHPQLVSDNRVVTVRSTDAAKPQPEVPRFYRTAVPALQRWLSSEPSVKGQAVQFAPLTRVAARMCANSPGKRLEHLLGVPEMASHPACDLVALLSAPADTPNSPAFKRLIEAAPQQACAS